MAWARRAYGCARALLPLVVAVERAVIAATPLYVHAPVLPEVPAETKTEQVVQAMRDFAHTRGHRMVRVVVGNKCRARCSLCGATANRSNYKEFLNTRCPKAHSTPTRCRVKRKTPWRDTVYASCLVLRRCPAVKTPCRSKAYGTGGAAQAPDGGEAPTAADAAPAHKRVRLRTKTAQDDTVYGPPLHLVTRREGRYMARARAKAIREAQAANRGSANAALQCALRDAPIVVAQPDDITAPPPWFLANVEHWRRRHPYYVGGMAFCRSRGAHDDGQFRSPTLLHAPCRCPSEMPKATKNRVAHWTRGVVEGGRPAWPDGGDTQAIRVARRIDMATEHDGVVAFAPIAHEG